MYNDLLDFAARALVPGGRLVYWLPVPKHGYCPEQVPRHPALVEVANSVQPLAGRLARALITMERREDGDVSGEGAHTARPIGAALREQYFEKPAAAPPPPPGRRVAEVPGFHAVAGAVSPDAWAALEGWLDTDGTIPWERAREGRRVAQYGARYDYASQGVEAPGSAPSIPAILLQLLPEAGAGMTQCIVNVYEAEHDIPWHVDHAAFGPEVLVFTFGDPRPLRLRRTLPDADGNGVVHRFSADVGHCWMYRLAGEARSSWEHSVPAGRGRRVSVTFRSMA